MDTSRQKPVKHLMSLQSSQKNEAQTKILEIFNCKENQIYEIVKTVLYELGYDVLDGIATKRDANNMFSNREKQVFHIGGLK